MTDIRNILRNAGTEIADATLGVTVRAALGEEAFRAPAGAPLDMTTPSTPERAIYQLSQIGLATHEQKEQILRQCTECWRLNGQDNNLARALVNTLTQLAVPETSGLRHGKHNPQDSINYLEQADIIARTAMGENSPESARIRAQLGRARTDNGDHEWGEQLLLQALRTQEANLGPLHRDTMATRQFLISNLQSQGPPRTAEAEQLASRHLELTARARGENHADTAAAAQMASYAAECNGNLGGAAGLRRRAAAIAGEINDPVLQVHHLEEVSRLALQQGDNLQANTTINQTIELARRRLGNDNIPASLFSLQSDALTALGDTEGARLAMAEHDRRRPNKMLQGAQNMKPAAIQNIVQGAIQNMLQGAPLVPKIVIPFAPGGPKPNQ